MTDSQASGVSSLLARAEHGDHRAQNELLERYRPRLRRMIAMRLDQRVAVRVDASDIVQDALNTAHERFSAYLSDPKLAFYPWLRRIAWDRLLKIHRDHIDSQKRSVLKEHPWTPNLNDESVAQLAHCIVTGSISPSQRMIEAEMQDRTQRALVMLKPLDREILTLRYL
jgi:RNA polymerase sigma-70 factor (ECF subfamily)